MSAHDDQPWRRDLRHTKTWRLLWRSATIFPVVPQTSFGSPAVRPPIDLTRGFASPPRGGFAFVGTGPPSTDRSCNRGAKEKNSRRALRGRCPITLRNKPFQAFLRMEGCLLDALRVLEGHTAVIGSVSRPRAAVQSPSHPETPEIASEILPL